MLTCNKHFRFESLELVAFMLQEQLDIYVTILIGLGEACTNWKHQWDELMNKCHQFQYTLDRYMETLTQWYLIWDWFGRRAWSCNILFRGMIVYEEPPSVVRKSGSTCETRMQKKSRAASEEQPNESGVPSNQSEEQSKSKVPFNIEVKYACHSFWLASYIIL